MAIFQCFSFLLLTCVCLNIIFMQYLAHCRRKRFGNIAYNFQNTFLWERASGLKVLRAGPALYKGGWIYFLQCSLNLILIYFCVAFCFASFCVFAFLVDTGFILQMY